MTHQVTTRSLLRRPAEFLVHDWFPWSAIMSTGVIDQAIAARIESILARAPHKPSVEVRRDWYYLSI